MTSRDTAHTNAGLRSSPDENVVPGVWIRKRTWLGSRQMSAGCSPRFPRTGRAAFVGSGQGTQVHTDAASNSKMLKSRNGRSLGDGKTRRPSRQLDGGDLDPGDARDQRTAERHQRDWPRCRVCHDRSDPRPASNAEFETRSRNAGRPWSCPCGLMRRLTLARMEGKGVGLSVPRPKETVS